MALFKIFNNIDSQNSLPTKYTKGYCYFDATNNKFYIDITGTGGTTGTRVALNANIADISRMVENNNFKAGSSAIVADNIIVADSGANGYYKHLKAGTAFNITMPIMYASKAVAANANGTGAYITAPFTVTTTQNISLTSHQPVFIKGQLNGIIFTPVSSSPLTQEQPTSVNGYQYIYLGYAVSTSMIFLTPDHPVYEFVNGKFQLREPKRDSIIIETGSGTAAKVGVGNFDFTGGQNAGLFQVMLVNGNTVQNAITLNINGTGAKPIYINGSASSSSNYTLKSGPYLVAYDGTKYDFRTDGMVPGPGAATATGDFVTLNTNQTITGVKTFSNSININDWNIVEDSTTHALAFSYEG